MEDASVDAISRGAGQRGRIADLVRASEVIFALAIAAELLEAQFEALSDQCGRAGRAMLADADEPQIQGQARQSVPLFQFVA